MFQIRSYLLPSRSRFSLFSPIHAQSSLLVRVITKTVFPIATFAGAYSQRAATAGVSRVACHLHLADMPSPLPRWDRVGGMSFNSTTTAAFPELMPGRLPHYGLSRPAQRSLTLRPAHSLSRQKRPVASEASTISLPPSSLRLLPAGTTVAGRDSNPLKMHAFARRTLI
jgi:hypothetical protein